MLSKNPPTPVGVGGLRLLADVCVRVQKYRFPHLVRPILVLRPFRPLSTHLIRHRTPMRPNRVALVLSLDVDGVDLSLHRSVPCGVIATIKK